MDKEDVNAYDGMRFKKKQGLKFSPDTSSLPPPPSSHCETPIKTFLGGQEIKLSSKLGVL